MPIRLLHTADWQLGKPFASFPADVRASLTDARLAAVRQICRLADERAVDAVLVAGDVFDANTVPDRLLRQTMHALSSCAVPVLLLPGNHDAALASSVWTRLEGLDVPAHVHLLTRPEPIALLDGRLVVLPAPLTQRHEPLDVTAWFDEAGTPPGSFRVGLAHGSVGGRLPERADAANPISERRADTARLDYLALGDWHGTLEIDPRTHYAGTPEPERFRNNAPGNVLIVELRRARDTDDAAKPGVEVVPVGRFDWQRHGFVVQGKADVDNAEAELERAGISAHSIVKLVFEGHVDIATEGAISELVERWAARARHVRVGTKALLAEPTSAELDALGQGGGFVADAASALREAARGEGSETQKEDARLALRLLYQLEKGLR